MSHIGESFSIFIFFRHIYFLYSALHFIYTEALVPETESIFIFTDYKGHSKASARMNSQRSWQYAKDLC